VRCVDPQNPLKVSPAPNQRPVQAIGSHSAHPPFRERVRTGSPERCEHRLDAFGSEHLVEQSTVRGFPIMDQETLTGSSGAATRFVACWVTMQSPDASSRQRLERAESRVR